MLHLHIYKTSSCSAVFFWATAFFDFCMTSESYPYHLKVAASAFVCVLFFPSMFTSFIILPINHFNFESHTPEEWKNTMQFLDYPLFSVEKRTKISSVTFCLWNTTIRLGPTHCCSESAVGKGEPPGGLTCQWTKCQTSCGLKCSFGGSVIYLSTRCVCVSGELRYK